MQVNVSTWLNEGTLPLDRALDPRTNIRQGAVILRADFAHTLGVSKDAQSAVPVALSLYNSGSATRSHSYANSIIQERPAATAKRY
jgi:hypothetical protein